MQIFYQDSTKPISQRDLQLPGQCRGAALCVSASSEANPGPVGSPTGSAAGGSIGNCNGVSLQRSEFLACKRGCRVGAQRDGNSSAVVTVFGEMGGWQGYQEGWCLFPDAFMEFLTIV